MKPLYPRISRRVRAIVTPLQRQRSRWFPSGISVYDVGEANFQISLDVVGTYPDVGVSANFVLSVLWAGDIGITQIFGPSLESRSPHNPASLESRV